MCGEKVRGDLLIGIALDTLEYIAVDGDVLHYSAFVADDVPMRVVGKVEAVGLTRDGKADYRPLVNKDAKIAVDRAERDVRHFLPRLLEYLRSGRMRL